MEADQVLAHQRRAATFTDMRLIFRTKIADGGQYGVGSSFSQPAQRAGLDILRQIPEQVDILFLAPPPGDLRQNVEHLLRPQAAEGALAARFFLCKVQEEAGDLHHAVILVQHHQASRSHHGASLLQ